jgi:hypothetical protein
MPFKSTQKIRESLHLSFPIFDGSNLQVCFQKLVLGDVCTLPLLFGGES